MMKNQFFSSLVINARRFPNVHQVFKSRYNKVFFQRLISKIDDLDTFIERRCKVNPPNIGYKTSDIKSDAISYTKLIQQYHKLGSQLNSIKSETVDKNAFYEIKDDMERLEDRLMPLAVRLPNQLSRDVPMEEEILESIESEFNSTKENLQKVLSHIKLSYINNCFSKSVVGPNSHYYSGIGAKVQHALSDYFVSKLESKKFILTSGLCLVKSAVVEAANSTDYKDYKTDPCRVLHEDEAKYTTLHLSEASRDAMLAFLTTLAPLASNKPLRLMVAGAGYRSGADWFDSDIKKVTQFETVHALTVTSSMESQSSSVFDETTQIIWDMYKDLRLPTRLVQCSIDSMYSNEYNAKRIDIFLPHSQRWIQVGRVSNYKDYLTVRTGMGRGHHIDSMVFDGQALFAAILENNQTATGKFIVPFAIRNHMIHMSQREKDEYYRQSTASFDPCLSTLKNLTNYEQKRYLVKKKNCAYSHSQRARNHDVGSKKRAYVLMLIVAFTFSRLIDWDELWASIIPISLRRFVYDSIFRPVRRMWWYITYQGICDQPEDLNYDNADWSWTKKTPDERAKEAYAEVVKPRR